VIAFQCNKYSLYMSTRTSSRTWWVMLIIGNNEKPSMKGENTFIQGSDKYDPCNGLKDTMLLFAIVVISTELDYHVVSSSM
jgi:hypothetical protein